MITAGHLARVIQVAARFGIPDLVAAGTRTTEQLAAASGTHKDALERLLRVLAANGLCSRRERGTWELTSLGETLRSDAPSASPRRSDGELRRAVLTELRAALPQAQLLLLNSYNEQAVFAPPIHSTSSTKSSTPARQK